MLGLTDENCEKGDIKFTKFCIIINFGVAKKEYCSDAVSDAILDELKNAAENELDKAAEGKALGKIKGVMDKMFGLIGKVDQTATLLGSKGTFGIGMQVKFKCCICEDNDDTWKWGEQKSEEEFFQGDDTGLTYNLLVPDTFNNFAKDYTDTTTQLVDEILGSCGINKE